MKKKITVGIVGAGWPSWQHIKGYRKVDGVEVAALCDALPDRLAAIADEYGIPGRYASYEEMLAREPIDAVSICTPNHLHGDMTRRALALGKHVLCEKPMAHTVRAARAMAAAARRSGRVLMVGHMLRFHPRVRCLKDLVDRGALGPVYFIRAWWIRRYGIPGMGTWFTRRDQSGGGVLIDLGVHLLDLCLWLLDFPALEGISASLGNHFGYRGKGAMSYGLKATGPRRGCDVEDHAVAHIRFAGERSLFLQCSWASHIKEYDQGLEVWGESGGARLGPDGGQLEFFTEEEGIPVDKVPRPAEANPFDEEIRHFIDCIRRGKPAACTPEEGIKTMELIEEIYRTASKRTRPNPTRSKGTRSKPSGSKHAQSKR